MNEAAATSSLTGCDPKNYVVCFSVGEIELMHEAYWGFSEPPFAQTPDPRFYYLSQAHQESLMMLHYGVRRNKGAILLTGGLGIGKTTFCHKLASLLDSKEKISISIVNPILTPLQFHIELLAELGLNVRYRDRQAVSRCLHNLLRELYSMGQKVVVIIDDAHRIQSEETFEEIRQLLNLQMDDQFLVNIALIGQPQLNKNLAKFTELDQMFGIREKLDPLSLAEMGEMILFRMRTAGYTGDGNLFTSDALLDLHRFSKGVPRLVCHLADHALVLGQRRKARNVDGALMYDAIEDFYGSEQEEAA